MIDNGLGIASKDISLIFEPYKTLKSAKLRDASGAGLGLYICKKLCKELNGDIKVMNDIDP